MTRPLHDAVAVCPPGLEPWSLAELGPLGVRTGTPTRGLVPFRATTRQLYLVNRWARIANRVLVRIARFPATTWTELERGAGRIEWSHYRGKGVAPKFRVTATKSKLIHTDAVAQRFHQVAGPPSLGEPEQLFVVRIHHDRVTVSVDTSGESLHKRGWRGEVGAAPLRENIAAGMLAVAGWHPDQALLDPFCGSGTIPIEAARLAAGLPPRCERTYAFERWPSFEPGTYASVEASPPPAAPAPGPPGAILASDRDEEMVAATVANAERAGVADRITARAAVVSHLKGQHGPGWVVTNPPYGHRVGDPERLERLYARFGAVVRDRLPDFGVAMIAADRRLARAAGLSAVTAADLSSGGIRVQILLSAPAGRSAPAPPPP